MMIQNTQYTKHDRVCRENELMTIQKARNSSVTASPHCILEHLQHDDDDDDDDEGG